MSVQAILYEKGENVATIAPSALVKDAALRLHNENVDALAVTSKDAVLGILSEHEIANAFSRHGGRLATMTVGEVLAPDVPKVAPGDSLMRAMDLLTRNHARHLLVLRGAKLAGLVSMDDVIKHRLEELPLDMNAFHDAHVAVP